MLACYAQAAYHGHVAKLLLNAATHPHTLTSAAGALLMGTIPTLGVGGWGATDWLKLAGAVIGLVLSFIAGHKSKKG